MRVGDPLEVERMPSGYAGPAADKGEVDRSPAAVIGFRGGWYVPEVNEAMLIDRVDQTDAVIGPIERRRVFELKANFRVVHVFVLDQQGQLLLQQIPPDGKRHPGHWGSSVAGYLFAGEGYLEAALRRFEQELGVTDAELDFFGKVPMHDAGCTKFIALFTARHDGPFQPDPSHIAELEFVALDEIAGMHRRGERLLSPTFLLLLNFFTHKGLVHVP
jgi:isopentenyl-diphosphate delta-isomerase